ncbi:MAG: arylsulfatase, partial [Pseudomonadota bacterium]|nr:arylsulfatase [Pseudomonadota bacterium]
IDRGDTETHNHLIAEAAADVGACSVVLLAHFSMDRARADVAARVSFPVLSPPSESVMQLSKVL